MNALSKPSELIYSELNELVNLERSISIYLKYSRLLVRESNKNIA